MTPSPETKTMTEKLKATYEARYCPGIPTDCCDYGVISHETGKEVCRVWDRDDVERITSLLNTRHPTPAADEVEAEVLDLLFQIDNVDPAEIAKSPSYIKETARAAIAALQARSAEPRVERWRKASIAMGTWLSAAYDDPDVCDAMKADIREWFSAGEPFEGMAAEPAGEEGEFDTLEEWEHEDQRELSALYNHQYHDRPQFNRGQMRCAIRHGRRIASTPTNPERLVEADGIETVDEDWLTDVIDDSIDMDWTGRVGAKAIMRELAKLQEQRIEAKVCHVCGAKGREDHAGHCSESW